ncbi:MAG: DNA gyrase inhibitor YacG [Rhodospirillales bacterium]|nr:DNA gyrase inhibitor YacG [Rhodospirillales bacterium]
MAEIITFKADASKKGCPMCGKPESSDFHPFCSKRCADLDLGKWLKEDYRIESREESNLEEEPYEQD